MKLYRRFKLWCRTRKKERISKKIERDKFADVYYTFAWNGTASKHVGALSFDKETKEIVVDEDMLLRVIMIVNPAQKARRIRLNKRKDRKMK